MGRFGHPTKKCSADGSPGSRARRPSPLLREHIIKVRQALEVGPQPSDRETFLEGAPSDLLSHVLLARCIQGLKVGLLPSIVGEGPSSQVVEVVVQYVAIPLRRSPGSSAARASSADRLRAACGRSRQPHLAACEFLRRHQRDVGVDIALRIRNVLQGSTNRVAPP